MKSVLPILKEITTYLESTRQVGHTTAVLQGARVSDCIVVSCNQSMSKYLVDKGVEKKNVVTLSEVENQRLRGCKRPLVLDNATVWDLFNRAAKEIEDLKNEKSN